MAERLRLTAAQFADKLLADEHADVLATRWPGWPASSWRPTSPHRSAPSSVSASPTASPTATDVARGPRC
jgi:hypothetical protein